MKTRLPAGTRHTAQGYDAPLRTLSEPAAVKNRRAAMRWRPYPATYNFVTDCRNGTVILP